VDDFRQHLGHWIDRVAAGNELLVTRRGEPVLRLSSAVRTDASDGVPARGRGHPTVPPAALASATVTPAPPAPPP
jgi:prevent-host-death family protein